MVNHATLPSGWRTYDISARPSQGAIPPIFGFWEEPVPGSKTLALKVNFVFPGEKWAPSLGGLKLGDVIVAVDGKTLPQMTPRQFHTWLRLNKDVGQKLKAHGLARRQAPAFSPCPASICGWTKASSLREGAASHPRHSPARRHWPCD